MAGLLPGMPLLLGVNIDHVATLRQARYAGMLESPNAEPGPVEAAMDSLAGGADSLTIHIRADRRHMQESDAFRLVKEVPLPLNLEMGATEELLGIALKLKPKFACIVPETREEITTEGGLDVVANRSAVARVVSRLRDAGIRVSLFIDPDDSQVRAARELEAEMIELHTGAFANALGAARDSEVEALVRAAELGHSLGLQINAGHGLNYVNLSELFAVPYLAELNIGHSIVSRAIRVGMTSAVAEMKALMVGYPDEP